MGQGRYNLCVMIKMTRFLAYQVHLQYFIKQQDTFFIEEEIEEREARFRNGLLE